MKLNMPYEFRDGRSMTAGQKAAVLAAWVRFLKGGLQFAQFTKALYEHLIQRCSFVAHYNRLQFYEFYFESGDSIRLFLTQFDSSGPCLSVEYGHKHWLTGEYEDLNRAMIAEATKYVPALQAAACQRQQAADITTAAALLAKHGLRYVPKDSRVDQDRNGPQTSSKAGLF